MKAIKRIMTVLILAGLLMATGTAKGQEEKEFAFKPGEYISYVAYFNLSFLWVNVGLAECFVDTSNFYGLDAYRFLALGRTHEDFDKKYKQRHKYESVVDRKNLQPYKYTRDNYEDGYSVKNTYYWNHWNKQILTTTWNTKMKKTVRDTVHMEKKITDIISTLYNFRSVDFSKFKEGQKIYFDVILDNELFSIFVRYKGKDKITTRNRETFNCIKFSVLLIEGSIFDGGEDLFVWITDDENHIPVYIETPIKIGKVKIYLDKYRNLKYPLTSKKK